MDGWMDGWSCSCIKREYRNVNEMAGRIRRTTTTGEGKIN